MTPDFFDNRARIVRDDLVTTIGKGDRLSVAASVFSMYAYRELAENGHRFTVGSERAVSSHEEMYDRILRPFSI